MLLLLLLLCAVVGLPVAAIVGWLLAQVLAARGSVAPAATPATSTTDADANANAPRFVVLIPAHDEQELIGGTVRELVRALPPTGQVLVVADNCSDDTAAEARAAGARVIERTDAQRRGKGYALEFGLEHLRADPAEVVVIFDADCRVAAGTLSELAGHARALQRPAQAMYLMLAPSDAALRVRFAAFAWGMRNLVRGRGLQRVADACQLTGSGMAIPWTCLYAGSLSTGNIVEDMQLGLDFAARGTAPRLVESVVVESDFPRETAALGSQRRRWEHGHLSMIGTVPRLLARAVRGGNARLAWLALDICIPPLAMLAMLLAAADLLAIGVAIAVPSARAPLLLAAVVCTLAYALAVALAWRMAGRRWLRPHELLLAPFYALRKIPLYLSFLRRRQKEWVRTPR